MFDRVLKMPRFLTLNITGFGLCEGYKGSEYAEVISGHAWILKAFIKPFEAPQRSVFISILFKV